MWHADLCNGAIFVSYVIISFCVLYVFYAIVQMKRASVSVTLFFLLWFMFVLTCGVTHLAKLYGDYAHGISLIVCAVPSAAASVVTLFCIREMTSFIASQVTLVEIFRHDSLNSFMSIFDTVCTVVDGKITSGTVLGHNDDLRGAAVVGALRAGNVVRIDERFIRIACIFDGKSACNVSVKDMMRVTFPEVVLDIFNDSTWVVIGQDITKEWTSNITQCSIADAKLSLALTTAHDLRTPLMNLELVVGCIRPLSSQAVHVLLDEAAVNTELMKSVISQTVDVGRLVSGHELKPKMQCFTVDDLFTRLRVISRAFETSVPILYSLDDDVPLEISTDPQWLWQISMNLLSNACKYTAAGRIDFSVSCSRNWLIIQVRDTGIGIPVEERIKIFNRFTTLQVHNVESTGIGLYIVKSKAELMGGTISVDHNDRAATGTCFTVSLPLVLTMGYRSLPRPDRLQSLSRSERIPSEEMSPNTCSKQTVLVVDDTSSVRRMICRALNIFTVTAAVNGVEALELMKIQLYTVVFMDVMMPILDGIECVRRIRIWEKENDRERQYIVMISANHIEESDEFDYHLPKPISRKDMVSVVLSRRQRESGNPATCRASSLSCASEAPR